MIKALKRSLAFMPGSFLSVLSSIEIEREDQKHLVLNADGWLVAFDQPSQMVSRSGKPLTSFSSVEEINIKHFINGRRFEWWTLGLSLKGGKKLSIGRSTDSLQVSLAAAHAGKMMSKSVRVDEKTGL